MRKRIRLNSVLYILNKKSIGKVVGTGDNTEDFHVKMPISL